MSGSKRTESYIIWDFTRETLETESDVGIKDGVLQCTFKGAADDCGVQHELCTVFSSIVHVSLNQAARQEGSHLIFTDDSCLIFPQWNINPRRECN